MAVAALLLIPACIAGATAARGRLSQLFDSKGTELQWKSTKEKV